MRKLDTNDFEQANIEYIEFWMLDPFIYSREEADAAIMVAISTSTWAR